MEHKRIIRRLGIGAAAVAAVTGLGACGSSSSTSASGSSSSATGLSEAYCSGLPHLFDSLNTPDSEGDTPADPAAVKAAFSEFTTSAKDAIALLDQAPASAKAGVDDLKAAIKEGVEQGVDDEEKGLGGYNAVLAASAEGCSWKTVDVKALDYAFTGLDKEMAAGVYLVKLTNTATDTAHVLGYGLFKDPTMTIDKALLDEGENGNNPNLDESVGGGTYAPPGASSYVLFDLSKPGKYGYVCDLPDEATGKPHYDLGMKGEITAK